MLESPFVVLLDVEVFVLFARDIYYEARVNNIIMNHVCLTQLIMCKHPSRHDTFKQCWFNVDPALQTVGQHYTNIVPMCRVCWDSTYESIPTRHPHRLHCVIFSF